MLEIIEPMFTEDILCPKRFAHFLSYSPWAIPGRQELARLLSAFSFYGRKSWHLFFWWLWEHSGPEFSDIWLWRCPPHWAMLTCIHGFFRVLGRSSFISNLENKEALCKWIPLPFPHTLDYNRTLTESFPQPTEVATMKISMFRGGNWGTERLSNLPLITQFVSGWDGSPNRAILLPDPPGAPSSHVQTTLYVNCWISVARCTWKKDWVETENWW